MDFSFEDYTDPLGEGINQMLGVSVIGSVIPDDHTVPVEVKKYVESHHEFSDKAEYVAAVKALMLLPQVKLVEAKKLYQPVNGTDADSTYYTIALGEKDCCWCATAT